MKLLLMIHKKLYNITPDIIDELVVKLNEKPVKRNNIKKEVLDYFFKKEIEEIAKEFGKDLILLKSIEDIYKDTQKKSYNFKYLKNYKYKVFLVNYV